MNSTGHISISSPFGPLTIWAEDGAVMRLDWEDHPEHHADAVLREAARQLGEYIHGDRRVFDLPLRYSGSPLQVAVCDAMRRIPFGETRSYGDLAKELKVSPQAIGQACGANPIPIIIPCHRVLAADGLGGFSGAGGVETKVALLRHEGAASLLI